MLGKRKLREARREKDGMQLTLGSGACLRVIEDAPATLARYVEEEGRRYLAYVPITSADRLAPEDLAVTLLINSRATYRAFKSIQDHANTLDLAAHLPARPLERTDGSDRVAVAALIARVASWPGFGASLASKVLNKKRPALIPILDNRSIFGAYLNPAWPTERSRADSVWSVTRISQAQETIAFDVRRPENEPAWAGLSAIEPDRSCIELFDMIWWVHFHDLEPMPPASGLS
jgi:hypothetical protein